MEFTTPAYAAIEAPQSEIVNVITEAGLTPDGEDLTQLAQAIEEMAEVAVEAHASLTNNPHQVTAAQVGAYTEAETDTAISTAVDAHASRTDNPHQVTATQLGIGSATTEAQGLVELATTAETQAGTDTQRAVTPAGLAAALGGVSPANMASAVTHSEFSITATIPYDNTIPQNTEGVEVLSLSYTPQSVTSTLVVMANFTGASTASQGGAVIASLFVDSAADAVAVSQSNWVLSEGQDIVVPPIIHILENTNGATKNFSLRAGSNSYWARTVYLNRSYFGSCFGGLHGIRLTVLEIG